MKIKKSIMVYSLILITLLMAAAILFLSSTLYKVSRIENEWQIDLPNHMRLEYDSSKVHIDGSTQYYVFTTDESPTEEIFYMNEVHDKNVFETLFLSSLEGLGMSSGEVNILHEFNPILDEDHKYILLSDIKGSRVTYLYLIFSSNTNRIFICYQVSQYKLF